MAEKEIVIEYGGRSYGKAAIQDLLQRVDAMRTSGEEMGKEIASLKRQIGGLKTSNANYRKQVENLTKQLDMANLTIDELHGQIASYNNQILDMKDKMAALKEENKDLYEIIEYEKKPWWKKLF